MVPMHKTAMALLAALLALPIWPGTGEPAAPSPITILLSPDGTALPAPLVSGVQPDNITFTLSPAPGDPPLNLTVSGRDGTLWSFAGRWGRQESFAGGEASPAFNLTSGGRATAGFLLPDGAEVTDGALSVHLEEAPLPEPPCDVANEFTLSVPASTYPSAARIPGAERDGLVAVLDDGRTVPLTGGFAILPPEVSGNRTLYLCPAGESQAQAPAPDDADGPAPVGLAFDGNRTLLTYTYSDTAVVESDGLRLAVAGAPRPWAVAPGPGGTFYVSHPSLGEVRAYSAGGTLLHSIGKGVLSNPHAVAVGGDGNLYVADTGNGRAAIFSSGGTLLRTVPAGQEPFAFALSGDYLYYPDNATILRIPLAGSSPPVPVARLGPGLLPTALAVRDGALAVVDRWSHRLVVIGDGARPLDIGGGLLSQPSGVAFDGSGNVVVADTGNRRLLAILPEDSVGEAAPRDSTPGRVRLIIGGAGAVEFGAAGDRRVELPVGLQARCGESACMVPLSLEGAWKGTVTIHSLLVNYTATARFVSAATPVVLRAEDGGADISLERAEYTLPAGKATGGERYSRSLGTGPCTGRLLDAPPGAALSPDGTFTWTPPASGGNGSVIALFVADGTEFSVRFSIHAAQRDNISRTADAPPERARTPPAPDTGSVSTAGGTGEPVASSPTDRTGRAPGYILLGATALLALVPVAWLVRSGIFPFRIPHSSHLPRLPSRCSICLGFVKTVDDWRLCRCGRSYHRECFGRCGGCPGCAGH